MMSQSQTDVGEQRAEGGRCVLWAGCLALVAGLCAFAHADEWPTYRHDMRRSAASPDTVGPELTQRWAYVPVHDPRPAWPMPAEELPRVHCDNGPHVVVANGTAYFGSSVTHEVRAVDVETGDLQWVFRTEGPVRFAPAVYERRVYVGSDDGYVYCLDARQGSLIWRYRAGPSNEKVLGNGKMVSLWPVRTSVLVDDGVAYFGAGVFPYEGVYFCAVDARTGEMRWKNDTLGDLGHELAYGGISPHGYLVASEDVLYVPSGRAVPAAFSRETGEFLFYNHPGAKAGGTWALIDDGRLITGVDLSGTPRKAAYDVETGNGGKDVFAWFPGIDMVLTEEIAYILTRDSICAVQRKAHAVIEGEGAVLTARREELQKRLAGLRWSLSEADEAEKPELRARVDAVTTQIYELAQEEDHLKDSALAWRCPVEDVGVLTLAGDVLFAGGAGRVLALDGAKGGIRWSATVPGEAVALAPADGRLLVSTDTGAVVCFAEEAFGALTTFVPADVAPAYAEDDESVVHAAAAEEILAQTQLTKGYCLVLDCGKGGLAYELARRSDLRIVGIETDAAKRKAAQAALDAAGLLGDRVVVESWKVESLPDYFANLVVSDGMLSSGKCAAAPDAIRRVLRPGGGIACLGTFKNGGFAWEKSVRGPLEGVGSWTQQFGNPCNTACSGDDLVKGTLGVLWFGDPGPEGIVDRHAKAMSPVSLDGRMFLQGEEVVRAYDAYNGTLLWRREIPGAVRACTEVDGGNLSLAGDGLYVAAHDRCYRLNLDTGDTERAYELPATADGSPRRWGVVVRQDDLLLGTRAMPLKTEYAALWKELAERDSFPAPDEIGGEVGELLERVPDFRAEYEALKEAYGQPDVNVERALQRSGGDWRGITDYPGAEVYLSALGTVTERMLVSDAICALDPDSGDLAWMHEGERIAHITVALGEDKVFFAESGVTEEDRAEAVAERERLTQGGVYRDAEDPEARHPGVDVRLVTALDLATGQPLWEHPVDLTGCGGDGMGAAYHNGVVLFFSNGGNHDAWRFSDGSMRFKRVTAMSADSGQVLWSKPLNTRTRPLIVGDRVIIEPRACDLYTGEILTRAHPISGATVPWEFLRPGHTCAVTSASANALFYRSAWAAFYDLEKDSGVISFGGIRPGCMINLIPAGGLLLFPEASSGCTCSYPIRCSVVLKPKPERAHPWSVFVTHGPMTPVQRFAINLGAPADMKAPDGAVWLAYPNPTTTKNTHFPGYGVKFNLRESVQDGLGFFRRDSRAAEVSGTDHPWLYASGCLGAFECRVPLINEQAGETPGRYSARLGFMAPEGDRPGTRVFDVIIGENVVLDDFDIAKASGASGTPFVAEFAGIPVTRALRVALVPSVPDPRPEQAPILNFIEVIREDPIPESDRKKAQGLAESEAQALLEAARTQSPDQALDGLHRVINGSRSETIRLAALEALAEIGSPASLSVVEHFAVSAPSILWDYEMPSPELRDAARHVRIAIAEKLAPTDFDEAARILLDVLAKSDWDLRDDVCSLCDRLGLEVGSKAAEEGFMTRWHVIGPFSWDTEEHPFDEATVGEPDIDLGASFENIRGNPVAWRAFASERWTVDLVSLLGDYEMAAGYAYGEFYLDTERDMLLKIGSNDGFKCWMNGQEVGRFDGGRGCSPDQDVLEVHGQQGVNRVLLKISQLGGGWGFCARVSELDNTPIRYREGP